MDRHFARDADDVLSGLAGLNERLSGARILLTGAGGFLGVQFCHYFLRLNDSGRLAAPCHLTAMDNFIRGESPVLGPLLGRPDCRKWVADITGDHAFDHYDFIIHAASIASPTYYRQFPLETMDANVIGLRRLLDHATASKPEGFLFFSTSEIYGDPDPAHIPTDEAYRGYVSCTGPRACYDESKRFGETLCVTFARARGVPVTTARPFNNYGPGLRLSDRRVLPDLFRDVLDGRDLVLMSDGSATRTFCYISDAIEGYLRILLRGRPGEAYNIGAEAPEISIRDLAHRVVATAGTGRQIRHQASADRDYLTDNPQRRCPAIGKARRELAFEPRVSLDAGLERSWAYYQDHRDE